MINKLMLAKYFPNNTRFDFHLLALKMYNMLKVKNKNKLKFIFKF